MRYVPFFGAAADAASVAVTLAGRHDTLQDDSDLLIFEGNALELLVLAPASNTGARYTLDAATGGTFEDGPLEALLSAPPPSCP